jgi:hypothetical protein
MRAEAKTVPSVNFEFALGWMISFAAGQNVIFIALCAFWSLKRAPRVIINMSMCTGVCVCVSEWERERALAHSISGG